MFESIKAIGQSVISKVQAVPVRQLATLGTAVALATAVYFGLSHFCGPQQKICTETSKWFGLSSEKTCVVPESFCQSAINSVSNTLSGLQSHVAPLLKKGALGVAALVVFCAARSQKKDISEFVAAPAPKPVEKDDNLIDEDPNAPARTLPVVQNPVIEEMDIGHDGPVAPRPAAAVVSPELVRKGIEDAPDGDLSVEDILKFAKAPHSSK